MFDALTLLATSAFDVTAAKAPSLGAFERYLTLWVALCIVAGLALGHGKS
jgi:arsenite transporter